MKIKIFQKSLNLLVIFSLIFSSFNFIFINKVKALTPGEIAGQALAKGAICFATRWASEELKGLIFGEPAGTAGMAAKGSVSIGTEATAISVALEEEFVNVPVFSKANFLAVDANWAANMAKLQSSEAAAAKEAAGKSIEEGTHCIRDVVVQSILKWLADETVKWIEGEGQPGYVTNWQNFSKDAVNVGIGEVAQNTTLAPLCSPFKMPNFNLALLPVKRFPQRIGCTLDKIVGNIENFYNDFAQGGWLAYNKSWQPNNNFYGVTMMIYDEGIRIAYEKKQAALNEASAGSGFLSVTQCIGGTTDQGEFCNAVCSNTLDVQSCFNDCMEVQMSASELCSDSDGVEKIATPGNIVGQIVGKAMTSDQDFAVNIQDWTAAIIDAALNRLMKEGLTAVTGAAKKLYFNGGGSSSSYYSGGSGSYDPMAGANDPKVVREQARKDMIDQMKTTSDTLSKIRVNKAMARSSVQSASTALQSMKTMTCSPPVTEEEILNAQTAVNKLTNDLANIDILLVQINDFITYATNISAENLEAEFTTMQEKFQELSFKAGVYGTVLQSIDEMNAKKAELEAIQQRQEISCI